MLMRRFQAALKEDRRCRARKVGEEIELLVVNDQPREAWSKIQVWYQESKGHRDPPPEKYWNKPQPCGRTSTGGADRKGSHYQSWYGQKVLETGLRKRR